MRGLIVAAACVCLVAGCSPVPATAPPVGMSTEEAQARVEYRNATAWMLSSPLGAPMPDVTPIEVVDPHSADDKALACFTQATGIPAVTYNSRNGLWNGPDGEPLSLAQDRMYVICSLRYPYDLSDPAAAGLYSTEELTWAWNYQQTRLVPCLRLMGLAVDNRDGGYIPSAAWWSPYDEIVPAPTASQWERIDERCPPSPYGPTR